MPVDHVITPLPKQTLADNLASELKKYIIKNRFYSGQKLPSTSVLAKKFGVGMPTLREALKKLETIGTIEIKHGSGIFVGENLNSMIFVNPIASDKSPTKKQLLDLIEARMSLELSTVELAARNATAKDIAHMNHLLGEAKKHIDNDTILTQKNMSFHLAIAAASQNIVFTHLVEVISKLFRSEQRIIIDIFKYREEDYRQHLEIFKAIENHDVEKAVDLMRSHLGSVREAILKWKT
jgi:GntR family transcriptional repressor for pyruvate dehydrogenase complex